MRHLWIYAILISSSVMLQARADDSAEFKEYKALFGKWKCVGIESAVHKGVVPQGTAQVRGNEFDFIRKDGSTGTRHYISVDPNRNPKTIDFTQRDGKQKGQKLLGIYKIEDGVLTFVLSPSDDESKRPESFELSRESVGVKYTLKR